MARAANFYGLLNVVVEHGMLSSEEAQAAAVLEMAAEDFAEYGASGAAEADW